MDGRGCGQLGHRVIVFLDLVWTFNWGGAIATNLPKAAS